jgi:phospholipase/lecithinase/hemolysin
MAFQWFRRGWLLACASALLVAACGGGVESQFTPVRIVAFGDAFADLGQNGARYTVNDPNATLSTNWSEFVARQYDRPLAPSAAGGTSYATGNARVTSDVDAAGGSAPSVTRQIDTFLAANGGRVSADDLVIVNAGVSEIIVNGKGVIDGAQTRDQALAAVGQAGRELGAQVRRLVDAGAKHVLVIGSYNLERSPWARVTAREGLLKDLSGRYNDQLLIAIEPFGESALFVDAALYFNQVTGALGDAGLNNASDAVCTSVDPGPGIGIGPNEVNSNRCTPATILPGVTDYNLYLFADKVYPTPRGHHAFGEYVISRLRDRW